ncbi:MAG: nitrous oxide reductase accessory protein NosL [Bacteroidetes bacterium]|nr:nitrous oxide reductase accessory protein NosL [Bacteroidota bacterium]
MKKLQKIHSLNRVLLLVCAAVLIITLKIPMWRIDLTAPQYPEGLRLFIYPDHLGGDVQIVSGLNHYIGMKALHTEDFIEFAILPFIFIGFAFLFVCAFVVNRKWVLQTLFVLFFLFGVIAMIDFWKWEYNYGHNLNPDAPIIVPGMAYQPPLIGFKQLLNFGAYSIPASGGWLFATVGLVLLLMNVIEYFRGKKIKLSLTANMAAIITLYLLICFSSCTSSPAPIEVGRDKCDFCKMTVSDDRFGGEVITAKGKLYKFDDAHCLVSFLHGDMLKQVSGASVFFIDFSGKHALVPASAASFLKSDLLRSPMNGNIAAFDNRDSLMYAMQKFPGQVISWNELNK